MIITQAITDNIPAIMEIITHAQNHLALNNIDQWQNGYPNESVVLKDIQQKESFIVLDENNEIIATAMFSISNESSYNFINGKWLTDGITLYGVIHRLAVHNNFRGIGAAKFAFQSFERNLKENSIFSMRIDTHQNNHEMQHLLLKMEYIFCGIIYLEDGSERLAYEKIME